jgi:hypothetical protein
MSKTETSDGFTIVMQPVTCGSIENASFFKYTPFGELKFGTINPEAAKELIPGKEYFIDISEPFVPTPEIKASAQEDKKEYCIPSTSGGCNPPTCCDCKG